MMNPITFLRNRFGKFIILDRDSSVITFSRSLYKAIEKDNGNAKPPYKVTFWKVKNNGRQDYVFFVNPDWSKHGVSNPNMVFQSPMLVDPNGHISIKAMMPSVQEILAVYGIAGNKVRLNVSIEHLNGEQYYQLSRSSYDVLEE